MHQAQKLGLSLNAFFTDPILKQTQMNGLIKQILMKLAFGTSDWIQYIQFPKATVSLVVSNLKKSIKKKSRVFFSFFELSE